jgi:hypothetical protein
MKVCRDFWYRAVRVPDRDVWQCPDCGCEVTAYELYVTKGRL